MKNACQRDVPFHPYAGIQPVTYQQFPCNKNNQKAIVEKYFESLDQVLDRLPLHSGMTVSFHHHFRNGDLLMNVVLSALRERGIREMTLCASAIFPCHEPLTAMLADKTITKIYSGYIAGPVAHAISRGDLHEMCILHSHGYRATMLERGEVCVDIAFIGAPIASKAGDLSGSEGPSSCGVLGYAIADAMYAKYVVAITDFIDEPTVIEIPHTQVDYVVKLDKIGERSGIVSGTTAITKDPVGLRIAKLTADLIAHSGLLENGFTFQTGAGGISLAVAKEVREWMRKKHIVGRFASGGTTSYLVDMLNDGLFETLYDVQCFELDAVASVKSNPAHKRMSAAEYADILYENNIVSQLDVVILGATEIDLDYHVNVTTGSDGVIMGGSGGHQDTAAGAKLTIIVSKLVSSRLSVLVERVTTVTTPKETVDILVTDRGIAIHPRHQALILKLKEETTLPIMDIRKLYEKALALTGTPEPLELGERVIALSQYRDGTIIDVIKQVK